MKIVLSIIIVATLLLSGYLLLRKNSQSTTSEGNKTPVTQVSTNNEFKNENREVGNRLDLSNQGLEKIPAYVFKQKNLEVLDISNNKITGAIQAEIRHLQNLKILNASNNQMTGVPAEIGQLAHLEVLDLSNNQLTGLLYELGNLQNLKTLDISGNEYSKFDLVKIKETLSPDVDIIK